MAARADWSRIDEIHADYLAGMSCVSLSKKYGISHSAIGIKARKLGWDKEREEARQKVAGIFAETCERSAVKTVEVTDLLLDWIMRGVAGGAYMCTAQDVRSITAALRDIREIRGEYNPIERKKLEAQIASLRAQTKAAERENDAGGKTITVKLADGLDDLAE